MLAAFFLLNIASAIQGLLGFYMNLGCYFYFSKKIHWNLKYGTPRYFYFKLFISECMS